MVRIAKPTKEVLKGLDKIGISAKDAANQMKTPEKLLEQIYKKTKNMSDSERISVLGAISGQEALKSMVTLVNKAGTQELHESIQARNDALGTSARASKAMSDNLAGDLEGLSSAFDGVKITVFEDQNSALRSLAASATDVMRAINAWALANPELVSTIIKGAAVIAALVAAGGALLVMLGSLLGPLAMVKYAITVLGIKSLSIIPALKGIGAAIMLIGKAMIASPLGLFAAAAVIAAVLIVKYWDVVKAFFNGFISGFIDGFMNMGRAVIDVFNPVIPVFKAVMSAASKAFAWLKELLAPVSSAKETLEGAASAGKTFGQVLGAFAALTGAALAIKAVGTAVLFVGKALLANPVFFAIALLAGAAYMVYENWDGIVGGLKQMWADLGQWWSDKSAVLAADWEFIAGKAAAAWGSVTEFFSGVWAGITGAFDGGISGVGALILNWQPLGLFYQAFAGVMSYFGVDLPGKFSEFGGMIMQGLINGIKNMAGGVKDAVVGMGDSVGGWFKDKLGIKSPSRVFMQFGDDTAEGLALGIAANKDSPLKQVAGMAKQVAAAGAIALSVGVTPAMADNKNISQSLQPATLPAIQDQQQAIRQSLVPVAQEQQALPALTQNIQQMVIGAKQALPDLTQRIISVFSGPGMEAPELQKNIFAEQQPIAFDNRAPIASPAAAAQASASQGPVTNNNYYTINVSGSGDPKTLADEVMRQIEAYDRAKQVRKRSTFGDLD